MKKLRKKSNRGITLIALVITIIVLLILAAVSIATLTGENGILTKANDAKDQTNEASVKEQVQMEVYGSYDDSANLDMDKLKENLEKHLGVKDIEDSGTGEDRKLKFKLDGYDVEVDSDGKVTVGEKTGEDDPPPTTGPTMLNPGDKATKTETDNYEDANHDKATIPKDFTVSKEDNTIKDGLVVTGPDGSEFVWVPVPKAVKTDSDEPTDKPMAKVVVDGNGNYQGVLYDFTAPTEGQTASTSKEKESYGQGTTSNREPSLVTGDSSVTKALYNSEEEIAGTEYDAGNIGETTNVSIAGCGSVQELGKEMQEEYNRMVESVKTYGGFYVGRYETSLDGSKAQSKKGQTSMNATASSGNKWYGMYDKQKNYASENGIENIVGSSMIWGSQWDAMLNWMQGNGVDVTSETPNGASYNQSQVTGNESLDKINNVYDLLGCNYDWTLEADLNNIRVTRGGVTYDRSPSRRGINPPIGSGTGSYGGSRLALYIK